MFLFGRKKFPLMMYTIKVDSISSSFRRTTVRNVLNKARGVRRFRIIDYDDYGIVEVSGNFDPQKLLKKLAEKDIQGTLYFATSKPTATGDFFYNEYDHLYDDSCGSGYNYWDGHGYRPHGGAGWRCCDGDHDARCCGHEGFPPGPFAELAREFLGPRPRCRRPPPPVLRQTVHYVKRSVGCFNLGW